MSDFCSNSQYSLTDGGEKEESPKRKRYHKHTIEYLDDEERCKLYFEKDLKKLEQFKLDLNEKDHTNFIMDSALKKLNQFIVQHGIIVDLKWEEFKLQNPSVLKVKEMKKLLTMQDEAENACEIIMVAREKNKAPKTLRHLLQEVYCFCNEKHLNPRVEEKLIMCRNTFCKIGRYHYPCVGIQKKPEREWYCPICFTNIVIANYEF